jgi:hypothetical protein
MKVLKERLAEATEPPTQLCEAMMVVVPRKGRVAAIPPGT